MHILVGTDICHHAAPRHSCFMLVQICSVADKERKWCYLEASKAGIGLYQKHGFVVACTSQIGPEAPVMQHMGRPPQ